MKALRQAASLGASGERRAGARIRRMAEARARKNHTPMSAIDPKLLEILVCPLCKGPLVYRKDADELICKADRLAFPVKDGIPVMLEEDARKLPPQEEVA